MTCVIAELQPSLKSQAADKSTEEPAGLHVVDPAEHEDQESFGKEVERVMGALLAAEADRAVLSITALRDALEFYQRGGGAGGGTRAAVRKAELTARLERIRFDAEQTRIGLWIDRLSVRLQPPFSGPSLLHSLGLCARFSGHLWGIFRSSLGLICRSILALIWRSLLALICLLGFGEDRSPATGGRSAVTLASSLRTSFQTRLNLCGGKSSLNRPLSVSVCLCVSVCLSEPVIHCWNVSPDRPLMLLMDVHVLAGFRFGRATTR